MGILRIAEPEVGKTIIVSFIYLNSEDQITREEQHYGTISSVTLQNVSIQTTSGKEIRVLSTYFMYAPRGQYTLHSTGQIVTNPDLLTSWRINPAEGAKQYDEWEPSLFPLSGDPKYGKQFHWKWDASDVEYEGRLIEEKWKLYVGKLVIIEASHYRKSDPEKSIFLYEQLVGTIEGIILDREKKGGGIHVRLENGELYSLPPLLSWLEPIDNDTEIYLRDAKRSVKNADFFILLYMQHDKE